MMNFKNLPNEMVSGVSDEELEWIAKESNDRYLLELSDDFLNEFSSPESLLEEYSDLEDRITTEMNDAEKANIPNSTAFSTKQWVGKFKNFLNMKNLSENIETMPVRFLSQYLRYFYYSLLRKDGRPYAPRSLIGIRAAIHRYLSGPEVNRNINILTDREFMRANMTLKAQVGTWLKSESKEKPFECIEKGDLERLRLHFDRSTPERLQDEVWFIITLHFGLRGRETISQLSKSSIAFDEDADGHRFAFLRHCTISKNVKSSLSQKEFSDHKNCRLYEDASSSTQCPLKAIDLYFSKISENTTALFPQPKKINGGDEISIWYCEKKKLGLNQLGKMMKRISTEANLSKPYTNHCVRVTTVSELH